MNILVRFFNGTRYGIRCRRYRARRNICIVYEVGVTARNWFLYTPGHLLMNGATLQLSILNSLKRNESRRARACVFLCKKGSIY